MTSNQDLISNGNFNIEAKSTSRMLLPRKDEDTQREDEDKKEIKIKETSGDNNIFIIEEDYLKIEECTALTLGPVSINQKAFVCLYCSAKKDNYICKFCYYNCHQKCRDIAKAQQKQEEFKGEKEFACYCGNKFAS